MNERMFSPSKEELVARFRDDFSSSTDDDLIFITKRIDPHIPEHIAAEQLLSERRNERESSRVCSQSSQPDKSAREMNERQEGLGEFVVTRGDASEMLETCEEALD